MPALMAAERLRLGPEASAVCPADSPGFVMPTVSNCQRLGSMRRMRIREFPTELGCFAAKYLRFMPGARVFQSEGTLASKSEERPSDRVARSRPVLRRKQGSMVRESVAN